MQMWSNVYWLAYLFRGTIENCNVHIYWIEASVFLEPCENPRMPCPHISWDIFHLAGSLPETALVAPDQSSAWPTRCQSSGFSPAKSFVDVLVGTAPPRMMILPLFTGLKNHPRWLALGILFCQRYLAHFQPKRHTSKVMMSVIFESPRYQLSA